jgi:uncharacterized membrane protein (UPF0127 family)
MPARDGDRYTLQLGTTPKLFQVETVTSEKALQAGLSFRDPLPDGHGMLFVFPDFKVRSMWMPDMKFALDVVWLDDQLRVTHVNYHCPPCPSRDACPPYSSNLPAAYAIEMKAGEAEVLGFVTGVQLSVV